MVYKRPFGDEESCGLPSKLQRQLDCSNLASFVETAPFSDDRQKLPSSVGEGGGASSKPQGDERVGEDGGALSKSQGKETLGNVPYLSNGAEEELETIAPCSLSSLSWVTISTGEEDSRSEAAVKVLFSPGYLEAGYPTRTLFQHEEIHLSIFDHPPRRLVPVGSDHQAIIPICSLQGMRNTSGCLDTSDQNIASSQSADSTMRNTSGCLDTSDQNIASSQSADSTIVGKDDHLDKVVGSSIIPMPDSEAFVNSGDGVGNGRADCSCLDVGSIRCVRQHIMEVSEKLRGTIGQDTFFELGFCDMGEVVARKWTEEEGHIFQDIIFSNPVSSGKNFWDLLSVVFPTRTKNDLVSYYFNVFMLRKRAEQNRLDPLNIDSDNDEWQSSDDGDDEYGMTEEDEDSVVESPADQEDIVYSEDHGYHFQEADEDGDETYDNNLDDVGGEGVHGVSETHDEKLLANELEEKAQKNGIDQDDSCTSYEGHPSGADSSSPAVLLAAPQGCRDESNQSKSLQSSCNGLCGGVNHGFDMESPDAKTWNGGYLTGPESDVDLLPTCNMIKEVFGEDDCNNTAKDGKCIS